MRSNQRIALAIATVVVMIGGFVLLSGGQSKSHTPVMRDFTVAATTGRIAQLTANKGDTVNLKVSSKVADEIHVHGYDLRMKVAAGGSVLFSFRASIDGSFVIELESRNLQIAALTVKT